MNQKPNQNTLFVGNGFSRAIFQNVPSWGNLFNNSTKSIESIKDYTILYEAFRLKLGQEGLDEHQVKEKFVKDIRAFSDQLNSNMNQSLSAFGELLIEHHINDIVTTNYDNGIEYILQDICGYNKETLEKLVPEQIYNLRTYKSFFNMTTGHRVKLWKIHGDLERTKSITLGFDQYCGALTKLQNYVKGSYSTTHDRTGLKCDTHMVEKCKNPDLFDHISWVELFFNTNVYIVGFGMAFSEIDIWWLLNKRARLKLEVPDIQNYITYLFNEDYENRVEKPELFAALDAFDIVCRPISSDSNYLGSVFDNIT